VSAIPDNSATTARSEFAHHWRALAAATVGIAFGLGALPFYTYGLFIPGLEEDFGWSRTSLSALQMVGSLVIVLTGPFVGILVDRFGVRWLATVSLVAMGVAYLLLATSGPDFSRFATIWVLMYVLGAASTAVAFTRPVNERFDQARGIALGIAVGGAGVVALVVPTVLGSLVAEDWRLVYRILSLAIFASALVVFALTPQHARTAVRRQSVSAPAGAIFRSWLFVRLSVSFFLLALAVAWLVIHLVPMLRDEGVSPGAAGTIAGLIGIAVIVGRLGAGLLVDRFFAPAVAAAFFTLAAAGFGALLIGGPVLAPAAAFGVGLAMGAEIDLIGYLTARYFGMSSYSRVFGVLYSAFTLGMGISPLLMAKVHSATGDYTAPLLLAISLMFVAVIMVVTLPRFKASSPSPHPSIRLGASTSVASGSRRTDRPAR